MLRFQVTAGARHSDNVGPLRLVEVPAGNVDLVGHYVYGNAGWLAPGRSLGR